MSQILEKLWSEYILEECSAIDTDEERKLTQKAAELHEKATGLLNEEQREAVGEYVDVLCELESLFAKKAFCKGCEFGVSFLLEAGNLKDSNHF